ncbi:MAG: alpha-amylase family glycosyl hydrolase [Capsulimonadaceae bacterium]|nr:alpha-amylase family glycosyl hydrolase [Capsulimonadaceae bacterium]
MFSRQRPLLVTCVLFALLSPCQPAGADPALGLRDGWPIIACASGETTMSAAGAAVDVTVDDRSAVAGHIVPVVAALDGGVIEATYTLRKGTLIERYAPFGAMGSGAWLRSLTYTNTSDARQDLTGAIMRIAPALKPGGSVWNPSPLWMAEADAGQTLHVAYTSMEDAYSLDTSHGIIAANVDAEWRLNPGQSAKIGSMGIWIRSGDSTDFRMEAQRWYSAAGIHVPVPTPNWLATAILYEANAGGHIESRYSDVGGFDALAHHLDYLHDLGINAIWHNFVFAFKTPPDGATGGWNPYVPLDYTKIDTVLGGSEALKRLTDKARTLGIHNIAEIVPWASAFPTSPELDEWWYAGRNGQRKPIEGLHPMDYASPPWQAVMHDSCRRIARDFGFEGVRIDSCVGHPNWTSPLTNHASLSSIGGPLGIMKAARDGIIEGGALDTGDVPILLPESPDLPEYFRLTPLGYGGEFTGFFEHELPADLTDAPKIVDRLREMLERQRGSLPEGAMTLRTLNNHDTVIANGRVQQRFGAGLSRAFLGLCLATPGVPMIYQEQEIGDYDAIRPMLWARRQLHELGAGEPDYYAATFAPQVFTVVSTLNGSRALALVNLSGATVSGKVSLSQALHIETGTPVVDGVSGRSASISDGGFIWTLAPYETALMRIGGTKSITPAPVERFAGETYAAARLAPASSLVWNKGEISLELSIGNDPVTKTVDGARTTIVLPYGKIVVNRTSRGATVQADFAEGAPALRLVAHGADRWLVSGRTAILNDRALQRHFPFPAESNYRWNRKIAWGSAGWGRLYNGVAPDGRLWQSITEPLHPDEPGLAFVGRDGSGIALTDIATDAENVVLTDCTDEVNSEPYRLETRFYATDADLSPRVRAFGLGTQWQADNSLLPTANQRGLHARFTIETIDRDARSRFTHPRLPVQRTAMHETLAGAKTKYLHSFAVWLPEPGEVRWDGFAPAAGTYRIQFELRNSGQSAEGTDFDEAYTVRVDGVVQPLTWIKRGTSTFGNAYFGFAETPPIDLSKTSHSITITSTRPWAAVREHYKLVEAK